MPIGVQRFVITTVVSALLAAAMMPPHVVNELADGYYCATAHYLAYETLLHAEPEHHLLHVVPFSASNGASAAVTVGIPDLETKGMRCSANAIDVLIERSVVRIALDGAYRPGAPIEAPVTPDAADRMRAGASRLWGEGSWARSGSRRTLLRRFPDGSRIDLQIDRVSSGGATCTSRVGTRLVWIDARGHERASRPIFYRQLDCRRVKLDGGPLRDYCRAHLGRVLHVFEGRVLAGRPFTRNVGRFVFELRPENGGWSAVVRRTGRPQNLISLIPLHGPRATDIVADTVDNRAAVKVSRRPFSFSPDVGRTIVVNDDAERMLADDVRIEAYGRGVIEIRDYAFATPSQGQAGFAWLEFRACLSWPAGRP